LLQVASDALTEGAHLLRPQLCELLCRLTLGRRTLRLLLETTVLFFDELLHCRDHLGGESVTILSCDLVVLTAREPRQSVDLLFARIVAASGQHRAVHAAELQALLAGPVVDERQQLLAVAAHDLDPVDVEIGAELGDHRRSDLTTIFRLTNGLLGLGPSDSHVRVLRERHGELRRHGDLDGWGWVAHFLAHSFGTNTDGTKEEARDFS